MDNIAREHIGINTLRLVYSHYKAFFVPFLVIVVVVGVFIKVNMPAIADLFKSYEEQKIKKLALENIQNKLNLLRSIDTQIVDSQFRIVSKALPIHKDFDSILNAISDVSNNSGVALGGFKFTVGSLTKEEVESEYVTLNLSVSLIGSVDAVDKFLERLAKVLPLSEVVKITTQKDISIVAIEFYYKPIKELKPNDNLPLGQISKKGLLLINEMSSLIPQIPSFDPASLPISTPSANPFF